MHLTGRRRVEQTGRKQPCSTYAAMCETDSRWDTLCNARRPACECCGDLEEWDGRWGARGQQGGLCIQMARVPLFVLTLTL